MTTTTISYESADGIIYEFEPSKLYYHALETIKSFNDSDTLEDMEKLTGFDQDFILKVLTEYKPQA